jgi:hypothetical protein
VLDPLRVQHLRRRGGGQLSGELLEVQELGGEGGGEVVEPEQDVQAPDPRLDGARLDLPQRRERDRTAQGLGPLLHGPEAELELQTSVPQELTNRRRWCGVPRHALIGYTIFAVIATA